MSPNREEPQRPAPTSSPPSISTTSRSSDTALAGCGGCSELSRHEDRGHRRQACPEQQRGAVALVQRNGWPGARTETGLATASRDGASRVYVADLDELVNLNRGKVTRGLTAEECQKFLYEDPCPN